MAHMRVFDKHLMVSAYHMMVIVYQSLCIRCYPFQERQRGGGGKTTRWLRSYTHQFPRNLVEFLK